MNLHAYTPASDTHELRTDLRGPYWATETVELHLLDLRPAVTRYERPARLRRFLDSPFAEDVRSRLPRIPIAVGGLLVGYVLMQVMNTVALVAS